MYDVAAGNFDGNKAGKSAQIAMVYTKAYSANGGLYLKFGDAKGTDTNAYGTSIELLSQDKKLGNPDLLMDEKKVENGMATVLMRLLYIFRKRTIQESQSIRCKKREMTIINLLPTGRLHGPII